MKTKLLFFLLLAVSLQLSINTHAMGLITGQRIKLKDKTLSNSHRSMPILPVAFIDGSLLSVDFPIVADSVTVTVKDEETGEIICSSTDLNVTELLIDLTGECVGKYMLEIQIATTVFAGEFEL